MPSVTEELPFQARPDELHRLLQRVHRRAYEIYRDRVAAHRPGSETEDWSSAEREVLGDAGLDLESAEEPPEPVLPAPPPLTKRFDELTARDVMTRRVVAVTPECTIPQIASALVENDISAVPVVDGAKRLVGVMTAADILRCGVHAGATVGQAMVSGPRGAKVDPVQRGRLTADLLVAAQVGPLCARSMVVAPPYAGLRDVARLMCMRGVHRVFVVDGEKLEGVVSTWDVARALAEAPV